MMNHSTTEVFFEDLRVPVENLLGEEGKGFRYILGGMNAERVLIGAGSADTDVAEAAVRAVVVEVHSERERTRLRCVRRIPQRRQVEPFAFDIGIDAQTNRQINQPV